MTTATTNAAAGTGAGQPERRRTATQLSFFLLLLLLLPAGTGCKDRAAQQEVADARAKVQAMRLNLERAAKEISDLKAERDAIRQNRDELQEKVTQIVQERDQVSLLAQQSQSVIKDLTTRTSGQLSATAALEQQVAQLKALVEEQQKTIERLKSAVAAPPTTSETPGEGAAEPNEGQ